MSDAEDILSRIRNDPRTKTATLARKERIEAIQAADARKARELVKKGYVTLWELARDIAKVTGEADAKHGLEEAVERFIVAHQEYDRMEGKPEGRSIDWMGDQTGQIGTLPESAAQHRHEFADAWHDMLAKVNGATKVGVQKRYRGGPITLLVDIDVRPL